MRVEQVWVWDNMHNIHVVALMLMLISSPSMSLERKKRRVASDRGRMGIGCSYRVCPYVQTDSFGEGKRSALGTWDQADLVTSGKFLIVRADGVRVGETKGLTDRKKHGLTFWNKSRWSSL